ncbi:MAG: hypothetical protein JWR50_4029 [Mucilaginibacter sp.]|nr:hypothetical protein [Mucilaginibacter sp.]
MHTRKTVIFTTCIIAYTRANVILLLRIVYTVLANVQTDFLLISLAMKRLLLLAVFLLIRDTTYSQTAPPADLITIQQSIK